MIEMAKSAAWRLLTSVRSSGFSTDSARTQGSAPFNRVARGGVFAFPVYSAGVALTYFSQLVVARMAGIESYGVYAYVFAYVVVLAYVATLGFDVALLRFIPAYEAKRAWPLLSGVIQYANRRVAAVGAVVIFIGIFIVVASDPSPEIRNTFLVGFVLVPIMALVRIRCSVVRAFGGVVSSLAPDRVARDGTLIGLLGIATLGFGWTIDAPLVMVATIIGSLVGFYGTVVAIPRWCPLSIRAVLPLYDAPSWRKAAIPLMIIGATEALMNRTGVILLGWLVDTKEAGIYSVAFNVALVVTLPRIAVNTLFAPTISSLHARNDKAMMQTLVTRAATWTLGTGICIAIVLFLIAEPLLAWFGPGYEAGVPALRILLVGQMIAAGAGSQLYVMNMTGHEYVAAVLLSVCAMANAVASAAIISQFGLVGAAMTTAFTLLTWNAAMAVFLWRRLKLTPGVLAIFETKS
jgi:O-antigen/teichoic acid export membrane protein